MRKFYVLLLASLVAVCSLPNKEASAETLTFKVRSYYPYIVQVVFYSKNRNAAWPGGSMAYELRDSKIHTFRLKCRRGEKICFGAWVKNRSDYWGAGYGGTQSCSNCCYFCNGGTTHVRDLYP